MEYEFARAAPAIYYPKERMDDMIYIFTHLGYVGPCRELFGNMFFDILEFHNLVTASSSNNVYFTDPWVTDARHERFSETDARVVERNIFHIDREKGEKLDNLIEWWQTGSGACDLKKSGG